MQEATLPFEFRPCKVCIQILAFHRFSFSHSIMQTSRCPYCAFGIYGKTRSSMSLMGNHVIHLSSCQFMPFMAFVIGLLLKYSKVGGRREGSNMCFQAFDDIFDVRPKAREEKCRCGGFCIFTYDITLFPFH
jgi:hypothetical protein